MRFPVVLFDLDGTVADSASIILASFKHAARTVLGRDVADEHALAGVGTPLHEQMRALDPERADELVDVYRAHNEPLHEQLECCLGIEEVLARLREEGRRLGIVTAKRRKTVDLAFARLPLAPLFDLVVTSDDTERQKPHGDPLLHALAVLKARPAEAAYVGDAPFDIASARAAGVFSVAVTWGGIHSRERLEREGPDAVVESPEELLAIL